MEITKMLVQVLVLLGSLLAANGCVVDFEKPWTYRFMNRVTDFATTNVPLNDKYNCFDGCLETSVVTSQFLVKLASNDSFLAASAKMGQNIVTSNFDTNEFTCADPNLRAAIDKSIAQLTKYTAKAIATSLQYNLNKPGWVINVIKTDIHGQGQHNSFYDLNFCEYFTAVQGQVVNIKMGLVDSQG